MPRPVLDHPVTMSAAVVLAWLLILFALGNDLVTIATQNPHDYKPVLIAAICSSGMAALLCLFTAIRSKPMLLKIVALLGFLPIAFIVIDVVQRAPYIYDGLPDPPLILYPSE
jgi:hypothetical protein